MSDDFVSPDERRRALNALGRMARTYLTGHVSPEQEMESRRRFRVNLAEERFRSATLPKRVAWATSGVLAAAAAIALFVWRPFVRPPMLTFDVDAPVVAARDYLLVPNASPSGHLAFSDGSRVTLSPGTRGRIVALHPEGAELGLEEGRASLDVVHQKDTRWSVGAGPFAIQVTGTSFDVRWSGADELFEVDLRAGSVIVRGPLAAEGIVLGAGQRLVADLRANQLRIERLSPRVDDVAKGPPLLTAPPPVAPSVATGSEGAPSAGPPRSPASRHDRELESAARAVEAPSKGRARGREAEETASGWSKRVAAGDFRAVLAEAEQRGVDVTLAERSLADLVALADAARFGGRPDLAKRALLAQRERFPASSAARTAAFLLGRLADHGGDGNGAIGWYDRYLAESTQGEFASEALGRKMVTSLRTSGRASARGVAAEYLQRFPQGSYAAKARELTLAP